MQIETKNRTDIKEFLATKKWKPLLLFLMLSSFHKAWQHCISSVYYESPFTWAGCSGSAKTTHWEPQQQTFTEYLLIRYVYKVGEFELENLKFLHL